MKEELTTTAFEIKGKKIMKNLGIVRGIIVRSRSIVGNIGASIEALFGGNIILYKELCEKARKDAFEMMLENAKELGANGVIGIRYDATDL